MMNGTVERSDQADEVLFWLLYDLPIDKQYPRLAQHLMSCSRAMAVLSNTASAATYLRLVADYLETQVKQTMVQ